MHTFEAIGGFMMRRRLTALGAAAVLTLVVYGASSTASAQPLVPGGLTARAPVSGLGPNLLQNDGFETPNGSLPANWSGNTAWAYDPVVKRSGAASMRLTDASVTSTFFASQRLTLKKGVYKVSGWIRTQDLGLNVSNAGVRLSLDFSVGGSLDRGLTTIVRGTTDWTYYEMVDVVVPEDRAAIMKLEAYARPSGSAWFDDVKVERQLPAPVDVFMRYPNYRGMLFDDQSPTMRFDVAVTPPGDDLGRYRVLGRLAEEGGADVLTREYPASAAFVAELDGSLMSPGRAYLVTFSLIDGATGSSVYTYPAYRVSKVSAATRAQMNIAVDEKNRLLVHGRPRFLIGVYDSGMGYGTSDAFWEDLLWSPTGTRRMDGLSINFYLNYWYGTASASSMNALMSNLGKRDVMYLQTGNCFNQRPASQNSFLIDTSDAYVGTFGAHPGSAGYYTIDECVPAMVDGAFRQYDRLRRLDPDSMTFAALLPEADVMLWRDAADVISTDPYPMYAKEPVGGYPHHHVADAARLTREAVHDARPWMTVLQFFKFTSQGRWPTVFEMRSHAYMAIVEGTHGLWWWSLGTGALKDACAGQVVDARGWCEPRTQLMTQLKTVVNEIAALEPVLLTDDAPWALGGVSDANIRTKVKVVDGKGYVFAYNYANASVTATFTWNNGTPGNVTVNGENRAVAASGATFSDTFAPYAAHVYVVDNAYPSLAAAIAAPAEGTSVTSTVSIDATSTGGRPGPRTFTAAVAGPTSVAPMTRTVNGTGTSFAWDTSGLANGAYTLTLTVSDGFATVSAQRTVVVDNLRAAFVNPANGSTVSGTSTLDVTSTGGVTGARTFAVAFSGPAAVAPISQMGSTASASIAWNTVGVPNGTYLATLTVTDAAGRTATAQRTLTVNNIRLLTAGFTAPAADGTSVTGAVAIGMTSGGGVTGDRTFALSFAGPSAVTPVIPTVSGTTAAYTWSTTGLTNGSYTLTLTVTDAVGTKAIAQRTVSVNNPVAILTASFTSPASGASVAGTTTVGMAASGGTTGTPRTFRLELLVGTTTTLLSSQTVSGDVASYAWSTTGLANGAATLQLTVADGTKSVTTARAVTIANPIASHAASFSYPKESQIVVGNVSIGMATTAPWGKTKTFTLAIDGRVVFTWTTTATTVWTTLDSRTLTNANHTLTVTVTYDGQSAEARRGVTVRN
jgi:hypothetical protein